jgi:hypothetical protein
MWKGDCKHNSHVKEKKSQLYDAKYCIFLISGMEHLHDECSYGNKDDIPAVLSWHDSLV